LKPFTVRITVKATAAFLKNRAAAPANRVTLKGTVGYQACDDKVCFPPQSLPFSVEVPVKPAPRPPA
jgi:DsbC/DsbD-like thiol-disulfide interchange protein